MQIEFFLLIISLLFFMSILVSKMSSRLGVPTLLLFLIVGMLFGSDGFGLHFENLKISQAISTIALCIILFAGGMETKFSEVKSVLAPGLVLATFGVFITMILTGLIIYFLHNLPILREETIDFSLLFCFLLAATMSSTDSASVFSILRSKGLKLKNNLRPILELESGSNDPVAYVLTITFIGLITESINNHYGMVVLTIFLQLIIGAIIGFLMGKGLVWFINKINIDNASFYPILALTSCVFIFAVSYFLKGNSYLSVYIGGLVIGNSKLVHKRSIRNFFDSFSWLSQLLMFLTLGLLVNPSELKSMLLPGIIISFTMMFISRPLSVFISMIPFRKYSFKDKTYLSWVGLRGAVPIVFAILCRIANVPHGEELFNIVFICVLISLVIQGTTVPSFAKLLKLSDKPKQKMVKSDFDIDFSDEIKSATTEVVLTQDIIEKKGNNLLSFGIPEKTLVIMVKRGEQYFVPTGKTILHADDRLLIISDNQEELLESLKVLGIKEQKKEEKNQMFTKVISEKIGNIKFGKK